MDWTLAHINSVNELFVTRYYITYLDVSGKRIKTTHTERHSLEQATQFAEKQDSVLLVDRLQVYINELNSKNKFATGNYAQHYKCDMFDLESLLRGLLSHYRLHMTDSRLLGLLATLSMARIDGWALGVSYKVRHYAKASYSRLYDLLDAYADKYNPEQNGKGDVALLNQLHKKIENV